MFDRSRTVSALFNPEHWPGWKAGLSIGLGASVPTAVEKAGAPTEYFIFGYSAGEIALWTAAAMFLYGLMLIVIALPKFLASVERTWRCVLNRVRSW